MIALKTEEKLADAENKFAATGVCVVGANKILLAVCEHKYYVYSLMCMYLCSMYVCVCISIRGGLQYIIYVYRQL